MEKGYKSLDMKKGYKSLISCSILLSLFGCGSTKRRECNSYEKEQINHVLNNSCKYAVSINGTHEEKVDESLLNDSKDILCDKYTSKTTENYGFYDNSFVIEYKSNGETIDSSSGTNISKKESYNYVRDIGTNASNPDYYDEVLKVEQNSNLYDYPKYTNYSRSTETTNNYSSYKENIIKSIFSYDSLNLEYEDGTIYSTTISSTTSSPSYFTGKILKQIKTTISFKEYGEDWRYSTINKETKYYLIERGEEVISPILYDTIKSSYSIDYEVVGRSYENLINSVFFEPSYYYLYYKDTYTDSYYLDTPLTIDSSYIVEVSKCEYSKDSCFTDYVYQIPLPTINENSSYYYDVAIKCVTSNIDYSTIDGASTSTIINTGSTTSRGSLSGTFLNISGSQYTSPKLKITRRMKNSLTKEMIFELV